MTYVPLHVHSLYSPFEGMLSVRELVERAVFYGMPAIGLADHQTTYGHHELAREAAAAGIRPVFGAELSHASVLGAGGVFHLTAFAETDAGYRNLVALVGLHDAGGRERHVSLEDLERHAGGLVVLTGCMRGEAAQAVLHGNLGRERQAVERLAGIFGDGRLYVELQYHNDEKEAFVNENLLRLAASLGLPVVVTNNDRFLKREESEHFRILAMLGGERGEEEPRYGEPGEYHLKRGKDLETFFYTVPGALDASGEIAERCDVSIGRRGRIVFAPDPDPDDTLATMCRRRSLLKFHGRGAGEEARLETLVARELASAACCGASGYLLFLRKLFLYCAESGIWLEVAGGDLLGSILAYLLDIVPLDPTGHGLVCETFAAETGAPPALDLVKSKGTRDRFLGILAGLLPACRIQYLVVFERMGFPTLVKEIAGSVEMPSGILDELVRAVGTLRRESSLAEMLETSERLRQLYRAEKTVRETLHAAQSLHGRAGRFHYTTSRIAILPAAAGREIAVLRAGGDERFAMASAETVAALGGWIVGVQHSHYLLALEKSVAAILGKGGRSASGRVVDRGLSGRWAPETLDDPETWRLIGAADTTGIFGLESQGIRDLLLTIRPDSFDELVNVISLYRPAPLEGNLWQKYIENAEKKGRVFLPHHSLAAPLESTRGLLLFDEQVREILSLSAGITGDRAVAVDRALRTRRPGELSRARLEFIHGAMDRDVDEEEAQKIFDFLLYAIPFTHARSLSVFQAYLGYRIAFLKAHFPVEYLAQLLNSNFDVRERSDRYAAYMSGRGIVFFPPDMNKSGEEYLVEAGGVRAPLRNLAFLDVTEREAIVEERARGGEYDSMRDFLERLAGRIDYATAGTLVETGFFDDDGRPRDVLMDECDAVFRGEAGALFRAPIVPRAPASKRKPDDSGQLDLFGDDEG
ncbi:MAG: PHP domain-containing protein [Candidatus Krumholzibacteriota bacterium]|nr:PHP domain-containing protein [Candidatus Krumholzibacteriota bacterium]